MDKFKIIGPSKISGEVSISGSKNAALPILASTLLFNKPVIIENLPRVRDIDTMLNLLKSLGSKIQFSKNKKTVKIYKTKKYLGTLREHGQPTLWPPASSPWAAATVPASGLQPPG